jgi:hypothetical protein
MRRLVSALVDLLPLAPDGRRAMDETLADWDHEVAEAESAGVRAKVQLLGAIGTGVAVVRVIAPDLGSPIAWGRVIALMAVAKLLAVALLWATATGSRFGSEMMLLLVPSAVAMTLPVTVLLPVVPVGGRGIVGSCLIVTLAAGLNVFWLTPEANQRFRQAAVQQEYASRGQVFTGRLRPGYAELTVGELARTAGRFTGELSQIAIRQLSNRVALAVLVPVCFLLGIHARRWATSGRRGRWTRLLLGSGVALAAFLVGVFFVPALAAVVQVPGGPHHTAPNAFGWWSTVAFLFVVTVVLARSTSRLERSASAII